MTDFTKLSPEYLARVSDTLPCEVIERKRGAE